MLVKPIIKACAIALVSIGAEGFANINERVEVGEGSYTTSIDGRYFAQNPLKGPKGQLKISDNITGPVPTNDWWSSLGWSLDFEGNDYKPFSAFMHPHPLGLQTAAGGLEVAAPFESSIASHSDGRLTDSWSFYRYNRDFTIGLRGLNAQETLLDGFSDWTVTSWWQDGANKLRATFGHGLPFVYLTKEGF